MNADAGVRANLRKNSRYFQGIGESEISGSKLKRIKLINSLDRMENELVTKENSPNPKFKIKRKKFLD